MAQTVKNIIVNRISRWEHAKQFVAKDFLDVGTRGSVDMALASLLREGKIRRVRRGLYDKPKTSPLLGEELSPDIDEAARTLARRFSWKIVPAGAWAANLLGLSTQVPAKIVYLSNGPSKAIPLGARTIHFKHARPQALTGSKGKTAIVVQALRYLGIDGVDEQTKSKLKSLLSDAERQQLLKTTRHGAEWIFEIAKEITQEKPLNKVARMSESERGGSIWRNREPSRPYCSHHRKRLLGLLDSQTALLIGFDAGNASVQGRNFPVKSLSRN